jgi:hypothetical protein
LFIDLAKDLKRIKIAEGRVKMGIFGTCVDVLDSDNGKIKTYYLSDGKLDFKKLVITFIKNN